MVESLKEEIFCYEPKVLKTKHEIDTFTIHSRLIKLLNETRVTTKRRAKKKNILILQYQARMKTEKSQEEENTIFQIRNTTMN